MSEDTDFNARMTAARTLYEGTHGMTMAELAEASSLPLRSLKIQSRDEAWTKDRSTKHGGQTEDAVQALAFLQGAAAIEAANPLLITAEEAREVEAIADPLPAEREALLTRHKSEWSTPRGMAAEAVKLRESNPAKAFERAKMAKITAESLTLIQAGERRAHGIDKPDGTHTVVLERGKSI
uniref:Uncharacterized protein n=1 Tax=Pseudomonas phage Touem01 TaxID=3138548 RepID=A0AAU6W203_9VIRU